MLVWKNEKRKKPGDLLSPRNFKCLRCKRVFQTPQGLCSHLSKQHKEKPVYGENWKATLSERIVQ